MERQNQNQIQVRLNNDQALVATESGSFQVSQKDRIDAVSSCPMQMVLGALGACIMLTLNAVAKNKGIVINDPDVRIGYVKHKNGGTSFQVALKLDDHLTEREQKILYQSARICEVGKILKGDVLIEYRLLDSADETQLELEAVAYE